MHNRISPHLCKLTKHKNLQKVIDKQAKLCYHVIKLNGIQEVEQQFIKKGLHKVNNHKAARKSGRP